MASSRRRSRRYPAAGERRRFFNYPRSRVGSVRRWLPSWRIVVGAGLLVVGITAGVFTAAYVSTTIPDVHKFLPETTTVTYANGKPMVTLASENRTLVELDQLPEYVGNAVVASEDRTFWTNRGVDPKGILRAAVNNVKGGNRQGASTLTQQYVERYYVGETKSYAGKFREAILAMKISQKQSKEEILENYLNTIFWGRGSWGIEAASKSYFGKSAQTLTPSEAALLAGIVPSPYRWDPAKSPEIAKVRWERTINAMAEDGYITAAQLAEAKFPKTIDESRSDRLRGQVGYLVEMVKAELTDPDLHTGISADDIAKKGYTIQTTIDPAWQQAAVESMEALQFAKPAPSDKLRASLVSIDPESGAVKAIYGGHDYLVSAFNTAKQGRAQGGSTFKPFTLIGALEKGEIDLTTDFNAPSRMTIKSWKVTNFGNQSFGRINLIRATQDSVNTVYAQVNDDIGPETTADVAERVGITTTVDPVLSNVLGVTSVSAYELANAYATLAAQGYKSTPHIVSKVMLADGTLVYQAPSTRTRVVEPDVMAKVTYAMTQVVEKGSGKEARALDRPVAGKTGTSNGNKSAWFAGFTPQVATVVGLYQSDDKGGEAEISPFGGWRQITGSSWPVEAWTKYMKKISAGMPVREFPPYRPPKPTYTPKPPVETTTPPPTQAPETVTIPGDIVGVPFEEARAKLRALGLRVLPTMSYSDTVERGLVAQVLPGPGTAVKAGTMVSVTVSRGPDPKPVIPDPGGGGGGGWPPRPGPGPGEP